MAQRAWRIERAKGERWEAMGMHFALHFSRWLIKTKRRLFFVTNKWRLV
jgi:hypothetical protein